jgi:hypothetical protein
VANLQQTLPTPLQVPQPTFTDFHISQTGVRRGIFGWPDFRHISVRDILNRRHAARPKDIRYNPAIGVPEHVLHAKCKYLNVIAEFRNGRRATSIISRSN